MCFLCLRALIVLISISLMKCCEYGTIIISRENRIHDGGKLQSYCGLSKFKPDEAFALQWFVDNYLVHTCTKIAKHDDYINCHLNADLPLNVHGHLKCSVLNMTQHPNVIVCTTPSNIRVRGQPRINVNEGGNGTLLDVYTGKDRYVATCTIQKALKGYQLSWLLDEKTSLSRVIAEGTEKLVLPLHLENVSRGHHNMKTINCVYQNNEGNVLDEFRMKLLVRDTPDLSVTGFNDGVVNVKYGEKITATCSVANALRSTNLYWIIQYHESERGQILSSTDEERQSTTNISVDLHLEVLRKHHNAQLRCLYGSHAYTINQKSFTILVSGLYGDADGFKWEYVVIGALGLIALCALAVVLFYKLKYHRGTPNLDMLTSEAQTRLSVVHVLQRRPLPKIPQSGQEDDITEDPSTDYMEMHPGTPRTPTYDRLKVDNEAKHSKEQTQEDAVYEIINEDAEVKTNNSTTNNIRNPNQKCCKPTKVKFSIRLNSFRTKKHRTKQQSSDHGPLLSIRLKSSNNRMSAIENGPRERINNDYCSVLKERRKKLHKVPSYYVY